MNLKDLWLSVIKDLSNDIKRVNIITWFKNTAIISLEDNEAVIALPLPMFTSWHKKNYSDLTLKAIQKHLPDIKKIAYETDSSITSSDVRVIDLLKHFPENDFRKLPNKGEKRSKDGLISKIFNTKYSLDNFVVAPENRLAHAAAMTVAKNPGENYNPLVIYGGVGLGKTHILQGIGQEILRNDPSKTVVYSTTENFINELIDSIGKKNMNSFRNKYRKVDVFIVDDIQFLANKDRSQEEFFHTFNALYDSGKQLIISSDRSPHDLNLISDRLVSRFESGMIVDVKMPDYESRLAILRNKCQESQMFINDKVLEFIAFNVDSSVRALLGVLNQLIAKYELENLAPSIQSASEILRHSTKELKMIGFIENDKTPRRTVTIDQLTDFVSSYYTVPKSEMISSSRSREYLIPRQIIMYLAKTKLGVSLAKIGESLGNRNHTTVMHAINKMNAQLKNDRQLLCNINTIAKEAGIA